MSISCCVYRQPFLQVENQPSQSELQVGLRTGTSVKRRLDGRSCAGCYKLTYRNNSITAGRICHSLWIDFKKNANLLPLPNREAST